MLGGILVGVAWMGAALAAAPVAGALPVLDDWRKAGAVAPGTTPRPKGVLSPRAAEALVAAIDASRRRAPPRGQDTLRDQLVSDLCRLFRDPTDGTGAEGIAPPEVLAESRDLIRRILVLGRAEVGGRQLLLVEVSVSFDPINGGFLPAVLAIAEGADGSVSDVAALSWSAGDGCFAAERTFRAAGASLTVTDATIAEGELCTPGTPNGVDCCSFTEGYASDLAVGADGRFSPSAPRRLNLSGQFRDASTGEALLVEDGHPGAPRVGYRPRAGGVWKLLRTLQVDRDRRTLVVKFPSGPTTYTLAFDADPTPAHGLVSSGSDGTRPQVFGLVPWADRAR